jgi:hypothetical protein
MAGVIDPHQTVDAGPACRLEFLGVEAALVGGHRRQRVAHVADPWLFEVDDREAGNGAEDLHHGLRDSGHARMLVQGHALRDGLCEVRHESLEPIGDVGNDVLERQASIGRGHDNLAELDVARRAPGEDAGGTRGRESRHRVAAHAPGAPGIAGAELDHAAAVRGAAEDLVGGADPVQHVQTEQRDVRRLHHVAAEVHDHVGGRPGLRAGGAGDVGHEGRRKLQSRQDLHALRHRLERRLALCPALLLARPLVELHAGHGQHETWVHAVVAGGQATTGPRAGLRPARAPTGRIAGAAEERQHVAHDGARIGGIDAGGARGRAHLHAASAPRALAQDLLDAVVETGHEGGVAPDP